MSLPLKSIGDVKVPEHIHSWMEAISEATTQAMAAQARRVLTDFYEQQILISSLANGIHKSKGFGDISSEVEGLQTPRR